MSTKDSMMGKQVIANYGTGGVAHKGTVIGYCAAPQVLIEDKAGNRVWWRADMCNFDNGNPNLVVQHRDGSPGYLYFDNN